MTTFNQPRSLQQVIVSGATNRAQLAKQIASQLGLQGHNINNRRVIINTCNGKVANCIIDGDFNNIISIKIK